MHVHLYRFKSLRALMSEHAGSEVSLQALVASKEKSDSKIGTFNSTIRLNQEWPLS